jgi:short-subunit dehydrogenase
MWAGAALALGASALLKQRSNSSYSKQKNVLITGGSRGLGLALAEVYSKYGAQLVLAARNEHELYDAKKHLMSRGIPARRVLTIPADLAIAGEAEKVVESAVQAFGPLDIVINNAGVIHVGPLEKQTVDAYIDAMNNNFFSMVRVTYAALPGFLRRRKGSFVNIASIGGKIAVPHLAPYVASKFAAVGFSETLHAELRSKGIGVTTVNPGLMRTGSHPNAIFVGARKKEYQWFAHSATTPGLAHSALYAAKQIFKAVQKGEAEIEIGPEAFAAARLQGVAPSITASVANLAERIILPEAEGSVIPTEGKHMKTPGSRLWKRWSDSHAKRFNQPEV